MSVVQHDWYVVWNGRAPGRATNVRMAELRVRRVGRAHVWFNSCGNAVAARTHAELVLYDACAAVRMGA